MHLLYQDLLLLASVVTFVDAKVPWSCQVGQGGEAQAIKILANNSETGCGKQCLSTPGCYGFDVTKHTVGDSCRLYPNVAARLGDGGTDKREYCRMNDAPPTPAPPTPAPPTPPSPGRENDWAVIAAGSQGYMNYRHQADACHAYHLMLKSGIGSDHIILMMQDDVANSNENPFRGKLFNKKGSTTDVYAGCNVDYKGSVVTKDLFHKVLTGDESAGGKVLKSSANSRVFVNFVDHGGVGIVAFPNGPTLTAKELSQILQTMQSKTLFSELVFYMEACESGSMFPDLKPDGKILAVTAANGHESSWGSYCPPDDIANGKHLNTCLGDLFSTSWMEDADRGPWQSETFKDQVASVTKLTSRSHVQTFGDTSLENTTIGRFELGVSHNAAWRPKPTDSMDKSLDARDIHVEYYRMRVILAQTDAERAQAEKDLSDALADREEDFDVFSRIAQKACQSADSGCDQRVMKDKTMLSAYSCHAILAQTVHETCPVRGHNVPGGWNSYNMKFSQVLANICQMPEPVAKSNAELRQIVKDECIAASAGSQSTIVV